LCQLFSEPGELVYPSDIEALSVPGVANTDLANSIELAIPNHPAIESATGVDSDAGEAGADSDVQS
jgi:hypothetical protein